MKFWTKYWCLKKNKGLNQNVDVANITIKNSRVSLPRTKSYRPDINSKYWFNNIDTVWISYCHFFSVIRDKSLIEIFVVRTNWLQYSPTNRTGYSFKKKRKTQTTEQLRIKSGVHMADMVLVFIVEKQVLIMTIYRTAPHVP